MPIIKGEPPAEAEVETVAPSDGVFYLSSEVLGGRKVNPGDSLVLKVAEVSDGEIGVMYGEEGEGEEVENEDAALDEAGMEAFGEKPMKGY